MESAMAGEGGVEEVAVADPCVIAGQNGEAVLGRHPKKKSVLFIKFFSIINGEGGSNLFIKI